MATFRFELNGRPTKNKTYVVYLRVTVGGKRKLIKTPVELARPSDFNAKCKGENWVRGGVRDSKALNSQLADILAKAKDTYKELDKEGEVTTVALAKEKAPELALDGEFQFDAAVAPEVGKLKAPDSKVAGNANVFVFPNINAGNIGYKIAQRFGGYMAIGPICQGFAKPLNDLSRGCDVEDIVATVAVTALQAE